MSSLTIDLHLCRIFFFLSSLAFILHMNLWVLDMKKWNLDWVSHKSLWSQVSCMRSISTSWSPKLMQSIVMEHREIEQNAVLQLTHLKIPRTCDQRLKNLLLTERTAPVRAPLVIEFHGSSFWRIYTREQSIAENKPPHTAKFPAMHKVNSPVNITTTTTNILNNICILKH